MPLTRSDVYAVVREVINFKKSTNDTTNITAHVEDCDFDHVFQFIKENTDRIVIKRSDQPDTKLTCYLAHIKHLFNLPNSLDEEYKYCVSRNNGGLHK
ncbi:late expression factor 11 [Erinnyis ello granulovirus]|uniref:Late expression factor 11 n=1 Tax=Erinnyis ello granulovirus TaxID=307444 RepID=A0A097DAK5_9BBAC|nr:late expression factor 11 [Erinnyis ello granulovirus]AIS92051.1 late expression factor 11 [Erinnyis ello granulovirus]ARX71390.1 late expression factor 11 [Erinnyis ello granulovirus]ARX71520.1 late expression factor 11 [Erinnyis ello granulovirus]ARX71650.1 late expression factor 11 [Erinnyis ello granulovirus]ARX71780.1 late expression factor 11 [Erinnyis ello granulovirus]